MKKPLFYKEDHEYYCLIEDGQNKFIGVAICHPEDQDLESEKVGYTIALMRAQIKLMQHVKNNIIRPKIDGIKQLYYSINRNANYNANSVEARAIRKHLYMAQAELAEIKEMIDENKTALRTYLEEKETFKQSIRKHRNSSNKDNID